METEDQKKDRERLVRYVAREQLVPIMNDTKWEKLRMLLLSLPDFRPLWREQYLRQDPIGTYRGNTEWTGGSPMYRALEWVDIDPFKCEYRGALVGDTITDYTETISSMLKQNHIPFSIEGKYIRVWGYKHPGTNIDFA